MAAARAKHLRTGALARQTQKARTCAHTVAANVSNSSRVLFAGCKDTRSHHACHARHAGAACAERRRGRARRRRLSALARGLWCPVHSAAEHAYIIATTELTAHALERRGVAQSHQSLLRFFDTGRSGDAGRAGAPLDVVHQPPLCWHRCVSLCRANMRRSSSRLRVQPKRAQGVRRDNRVTHATLAAHLRMALVPHVGARSCAHVLRRAFCEQRTRATRPLGLDVVHAALR